MTRYLLDANHLSLAVRRASGLRDRIRDRARAGDRFGTCIPALCELEAGLRQLASAHGHRNRLAGLLKIIRKWPIDDFLVQGYGDFHTLARTRGRVLSFVDLLLAAMARDLKAVLLTTDQDFAAFPEIRTENWSAP